MFSTQLSGTERLRLKCLVYLPVAFKIEREFMTLYVYTYRYYVRKEVNKAVRLSVLLRYALILVRSIRGH